MRSTLLVILAVWSVLPSYTQEAPAPSRWDKHLIELDRQALDAAYRDRLQHLFETWMRDSTHQPARAQAGARQARRAYIDVMQEIERRESQ